MSEKIIIGICDNEQIWIESTKEYCEKVKEQLGEEYIYQTFMSGEEVLEYEGMIDILFLDIEMNGMNGIEIMKQIEDKDNIKHILFVSGYSQYVYDSFGAKTKGFICKPIEYSRFERELGKVTALLRKENERVFIEVTANDKKLSLDVQSIIYVQGEGRYARIITDEEAYLVSENLKIWEEKLKAYNIKRVHKSYLVNYKNIADLKSGEIILKNNEKVPVGRKYYETVKNEYREHLFERMRLNGR